MAEEFQRSTATHLISVVIPVYRGAATLPSLLDELEPLSNESVSADGHAFRVVEVLLVHDAGPDDSDRVIRELELRHPIVRTLWLSKNSGQHAATLAGMASSGGEWVVTLDEDGQHDPADIPVLLDAAMREHNPVVYAKPTNKPSHGFVRNTASKGAKWLLTRLSGAANAGDYQSYRLMLGSYARSVAAYAGAGVYLDVAIGWISPRPATAEIQLRDEGERVSGYSYRRLFSHFWRMVLTSGTRGLRVVSALGVGLALGGLAFAVWVLIARITGDDITPGWASTVVVVLLSSGAILFSLGVIAEYVGVAVNMAMGRPPYLLVSDPASSPLGRVARRAARP
jgi:undecaprenyl-phosphate 4-deoxy-4-formamido-L-arabinose transferase